MTLLTECIISLFFDRSFIHLSAQGEFSPEVTIRQFMTYIYIIRHLYLLCIVEKKKLKVTDTLSIHFRTYTLNNVDFLENRKSMAKLSCMEKFLIIATKNVKYDWRKVYYSNTYNTQVLCFIL